MCQILLGPPLIAPNSNYLRPYFLLMLPNLLVTGTIFFFLPALTRRILPNYVAGILLLIGYFAARDLGAGAEPGMLASLVDPFGAQALTQQTRYWTIAEQNTRAIALEGHLLYNRLLWLTVGFATAAFGFSRFRFQHAGQSSRRRRAAPEADR